MVPTKSARSNGRCGSTASAAKASRAHASPTHVSVASSIYAWGSRQAAATPRAIRSACRAAAERREAAAPRRAWPPKPSGCWRRSTRPTPCRTRSRLTKASAGPRSTASKWPEVLARDGVATPARTRSKSEAGTRAPATGRRAAARRTRSGLAPPGPPESGTVLERSVMSGKLATRAPPRGPTRDSTGSRCTSAATRTPRAHGRRLHAQGAHGVHGPRGSADGSRYVASPQPGEDDAATA